MILTFVVERFFPLRIQSTFSLSRSSVELHIPEMYMA